MCLYSCNNMLQTHSTLQSLKVSELLGDSADGVWWSVSDRLYMRADAADSDSLISPTDDLR